MYQLIKGGERMEIDEIMTDKERTDTQLATLYDLRLQIKKSEKEEYTKEDILELLDSVALEKSSK